MADEVVATYSDIALPVNAVSFQGDLIVSQYRSTGLSRVMLTSVTTRSVIASGLTAPGGLAATGEVATVADGLGPGLQGSDNGTPTWVVSSVAVGRNGTLFVTGDRANVVYRLLPVPSP